MKNVITMTLVVGLMICGVTAPAITQADTDNIARVFFMDPKPGMAGQFEDAFKIHIEWRKQHEDPWTWNSYQVVNGDNFGQYLVRSGNHSWSDLDAADAWTARVGANAHFAATVSPYLGSFRSIITEDQPALSRRPASLSAITLFSITQFDLRRPAAFFETIAKFKAAADQINWPGRYAWQAGVNGGTTDAVLVIFAENWAGLAAPETTVPEVMVEVYGEEEASALGQQFDFAVRSQFSYTMRVRPDLSLR